MEDRRLGKGKEASESSELRLLAESCCKCNGNLYGYLENKLICLYSTKVKYMRVNGLF